MLWTVALAVEVRNIHNGHMEIGTAIRITFGTPMWSAGLDAASIDLAIER